MSHTREEHIEMMGNPERWPLVTRLPLVKRSVRDASNFPQFGYLSQPSMRVNPEPPEPVVHLGDMYGIKAEDHIRYDSLAAIVDDGWEVD